MPRSIIVYEEDIPDNLTLQSYLIRKTHFKTTYEDFEKKFNHPLTDEIPLDDQIFMNLQTATLESGEKFGWHAFYLAGKAVEPEYLSFSLTYNPRQIDQINEDPNRATLGSKFLHSGVQRHYHKRDGLFKNTYNDSFSFRHLTPAAKNGFLFDFFKTFKRTLIRSRVSKLNAESERIQQLDFAWHNDEPIYFNLRVNIPILSSENFVIQLQKSKDLENFEIFELPLLERKIYCYDTHKFHRPTCKKLTGENRVNMIIGISPWIDYYENENCWKTNDYFGELHPFEIVKQGYVSPLLGTIKS